MSVTDKLILNICKWLLIFAIFKSQKSFLKSYMSTHYRVMNDVRDCWVYSEHQCVISLILCDMKCNRKWRINVVGFCCWVLHIQLVLYIIFHSLIPGNTRGLNLWHYYFGNLWSFYYVLWLKMMVESSVVLRINKSMGNQDL